MNAEDSYGPNFRRSVNFDSMWWSGTIQTYFPPDDHRKEPIDGGKCFSVPHNLEEIEADLMLLEEMTGVRKSDSRIPEIFELPALPAMDSRSEDPLTLLEDVQVSQGSPKRSYWSADQSFWRKWKSEELESRKTELEKAKTRLEESQREAAAAEAAAKIELQKQNAEEDDRKKALADEAEALKRREIAKSSVMQAPLQGTPGAVPVSSTGIDQFDAILEEGKQYRTEFIAFWRDISLSVSSTAANSRSIQQNATKLINALSRASVQAGPMRPRIMKWLCTFCGSKIATQATSGNKTLIWSFAYLARLVGDRFPDVVRSGIVGELNKSGSMAINGTPDLLPNDKDRSTHPKAYETHTRFWVALLIVLQDDVSLWGWVTASLSNLLSRKQFLTSNDAMWNMMKMYVFIDCGLHDFRRIFGKQAKTVVQALESVVFPALDAELQSLTTSTNVSVQFRFYLDACFNNLQSRNYQTAPEGQILTASAESELNPEL